MISLYYPYWVERMLDFMKKLVCLLLVFAMVLPMGLGFAAGASFPDLPSSHWAYSSVDTMVRDGRVNGFPDGTFKPNELVTRWQFAKMAGGNPDAVSEGDRPSTREEAVDYLWNMIGKPEVLAPYALTKDSTYSGAVAWAYTKGIMQGDDGYNLRLNSTLTRAEASTLIVRAQSGNLADVSFKESVSDEILGRIWDNLQTGIPYSAEATVSNQLVAQIASYIANNGKKTDFKGLIKECLGAGDDFYTKDANMQDMVALISYGTMKQSIEVMYLGTDYKYADTNPQTMNAKRAISFARYNKVLLYPEDKINATALATMKDVACVVIQLDEVVGLTKTYGLSKATRFLKSKFEYPKNGSDYAYILEDVPFNVYETPIISGVKPAKALDFGSTYAENFDVFLDEISADFPSSVKAEWEYYPSLVARGDKDIVVRAKLNITSNPDNLSLNQILARNRFTGEVRGNTFFVDISVGTAIIDIPINSSNYTAIRVMSGKE